MAGEKIIMKSSPFVIIVPLIIAGVIVASVLIIRTMSPLQTESKAALISPTPANYPKLHVPTGKPEVGFDQIQPVAPVSDLRDTLEKASDSSLEEFDALASEAAQL